MKSMRWFLVGALLLSLFVATPRGQQIIERLTGDGWLVAPGNAVPLLLGNDGKPYLKIDVGGAISFLNSAAMAASATPTDCSTAQYGFVGDTNTGVGYGGADTVRLCTGGTSRISVGSTTDALVGIGTTAPTTVLHAQVDGSAAYGSFSTYRNSAFAGGLQLTHARGTVASPTVLNDNDRVASIFWKAHNNTATDTTNQSAVAASIEAWAEGTQTTDTTPTRLTFGTAVSNASIEHMRITSLGLIGVGSTSPGGKFAVELDTTDSATTTNVLRLSTDTVSTDFKVINATGTWNSGATTFTAWFLNITDTTSAAASLLMDLQLGGATKFNVAKTGATTLTRLSLGVTSADGLSLVNSTAAAAGAQQMSPRLRLTGAGWKTDATAASQVVDWAVEALPVQGAAAPTVNLIFKSQINAGGYTTGMTLTSDGALTTAGLVNVAAGELQTAGNRVNYVVTAEGAGTAYVLTNSAAAIDFGTTDPAIVLDKAGTYQLCGWVHVARNGATVVAETATFKIRRTNNTAADLTTPVVYDLPASTTLTDTLTLLPLPCVSYTTAVTDDAITLFANVSAALGAGSIDATAVGTMIRAVRLY